MPGLPVSPFPFSLSMTLQEVKDCWICRIISHAFPSLTGGKKKKRDRGDGIVMICKNIKSFWNEERNNQFSAPTEDGKTMNVLVLQPGRFKIDTKKNFQMAWVMTHYHRSPEEVLELQSPEIAKDRLGKHLAELTGTADFACRQKHRVDDLLRSLSACLSLILDRQWFSLQEPSIYRIKYSSKRHCQR